MESKLSVVRRNSPKWTIRNGTIAGRLGTVSMVINSRYRNGEQDCLLLPGGSTWWVVAPNPNREIAQGGGSCSVCFLGTIGVTRTSEITGSLAEWAAWPSTGFEASVISV